MKSPRLLLVLGIVLLAGCTNSNPVACTMDAKVCPDGSAVGRVPPSCEFAACPSGSSSSEIATPVTIGFLEFSYTSKFAVATNSGELLVNSYIPPCNPGYAYCAYFNASDYDNTNFESAGFAVSERTDLTTQATCLNTEPYGYAYIKPEIRQEEAYATSLFAPLDDAAAGHYAIDRLYRISYGTGCYEIRQRIGETQFTNYPAGTKLEFTANDARNVQKMLDEMLDTVYVNQQPIQFPAFSARAGE